MEPELVDLVVVGLGVGGEEVAGQLAKAGLSVVGIERDLVGGECPYWGCVPSKMMIRAANTLAEAHRVHQFAGSARVSPDWAPVAERIRAEATDTWDDQVAVERFVNQGGRFIRGSGRLDGPGRVRVNDQVFQARHGIVLSTGTRPFAPPIDGLAETPYWTNHQAIEVERLPESLLVLGGGAIGLELTQVFARFGVRVTVVEALDRILATEEPESSEVVAAALRADGVDINTGVIADRVDHDGQQFTLRANDVRYTADQLLVVTGRRAHLDELGLDTVGVRADQRFLPVDDRLRVTEGIWAVGDVTGAGAFTHVATYQAGIVVADLLDRVRRSEAGAALDGTGAALDDTVPRADYRALPRVTFTDPEVGGVGLTESQARQQGINVQVGSVPLGSSARGWIHRADGLIKLVADADRGVLVGGTSIGPAGGEVLSGLAVAVHAAVPLAELRDMIYAYPTFYRAISDALRDLG
ncbi:dihydrolipoyl dehydrogenase family protein [Salinispora tropica]|uniref:Pyridine nucleotide-disulphide oxidoreductase dimerisation region n=1 Tax=Salinispora tropica (strain ATCC BAA-916 / DSM 44818 / JCM 13857 / NBRC 105044 / CNB-440) TaxID=369723 RepID=A4XD63_SALTO|nr:FAD-dependent oxidoreductase [Salinispora tropica]ABP56870.1 pyridine nucleotide-disulphide oxidoreductase dimerisation region [Salinispora tropica CNB-440]